jgi:TM2 domain-containing membrane protein YozV/uncharacterized Zn finger protein (UPF0148 family)
MSIPYHISKSLLGDKVHYKCPACKAELISKFAEIGSSDYCPICGGGFTVPGVDEVHRREEEKQRKDVEKRQREEEARRRREEAKRQNVPAQGGPIQTKSATLPAQAARAVKAVMLTPVARSGDTKACPFCGEEILLDARKCKHCGEFIDLTLRSTEPAKRAQDMGPYAAPAPVVTQITNVNVGAHGKRWNPAVAMLLSLIIPGLGQIYKGQVLNGLVWLILTTAGYFVFLIPGLVLHLLCILGAGLGDPYR